ncbi:COP9 signalosome complex subunit 8 isoform X1 [Hydra vulgaris]|nr:COP9 signalosome complex subunit 8 [Hydra vulgaris]XP_047142436.1 COP9 signalosome complex subunit 8 [Hydra vulgaris]
MLDNELSYEETLASLEHQELTSFNGIASIEVYSQLLTFYLLENDIINAKFLWKRIPAPLKDNEELKNIWVIGKYLWKKDLVNIYSAISSYEWSTLISPLMKKLCEKLRESSLKLISKVYTVIKVESLCAMLGAQEEEVFTLISSFPWEVEQNLIKIPQSTETKKNIECSSEDSDKLLKRLTDYIIFYEN